MGLGIREKSAVQVGIKPSQNAVYMPGGKVLQFVLKTHDVFSITRNELEPLFAEAKAQSVRLVGDLAGRVLYTIYEGEQPLSIVAFSIRIEAI